MSIKIAPFWSKGWSAAENNMFWYIYEVCPWIFETITILSKGLHIIQINLHNHLVQHNMGWLIPPLPLNGYDPVAFWRLIPPLQRSTSHYVGVNCTFFLIYYSLNANATINSFASNIICVKTTDTLAFMWKNKWNKCKKYRDIRQYKPAVRNQNNTLMRVTAVYFSWFFYDNKFANYWVVSFKMCFSLMLCPSETKI